MNINFELYKVFNEVATAKSISKAAENLLISQPAVTQSIKTLEEQLGGQLFIRTPKGVILTNEGEELYKYIKEGMNYFINGTNKFSSLKNLDSGVINIGSTTVISEHYLMPYLDKFHTKYPNVDISIQNDLTENLIKELRNGNLDIIIINISSTNIKDIDTYELITLEDIFVGNSKYKEKKYNTVKDLLKEDILLQKAPSVTRNNFNNYLKENNLECTPKMEVVSHSLLTKLTENGFGIALLTKNFIEDKLGSTLYEINITEKLPERNLGYGIKSGNIPSFTTSKFIEILKNK